MDEYQACSIVNERKDEAAIEQASLDTEGDGNQGGDSDLEDLP